MENALKILTVNAGSSSLKIVLFLLATPDNTQQRSYELTITGIGQLLATARVWSLDGEEYYQQQYIRDHADAAQYCLKLLSKQLQSETIAAVGYRIVHGGQRFAGPAVIDDEVLASIEALTPLNPQHAPTAIALIRTLRQQLPNATHVACFDTAFFHDIPRVAQIVPIPRKYEAIGVRRYGFHGLSYSFLQSAFEAQAGESAARGRVIYAHMGSGVSLAATLDKQPVDMTMGFTPTSGVMMSSRPGDVDPALERFLSQATGMQPAEYDYMINYESGLLGISELSSDMLTLVNASDQNPQAKEAVDVFCYDIKKAIGALATTIGGIDSLIFSGGIGEQAPLIRQQICAGLDYLGITLDESANHANAHLISAPGTQTGVHVMATDEAASLAHDTSAILGQQHTEVAHA